MKSVPMNVEEEIEQKFSTAVTDYLQRFNMLDRNIGYSVNRMKRSAPEDNKPVESTFHGRLYQFKELLAERSLDKAFDEWLSAVDRCRIVRNQLVHGHWKVVPHL